MDRWERVETRELLNPRINDLQGEITRARALHNKEKIERRLLQRGSRETEDQCWVGEELLGFQCEKEGFG